MGKTLAPADVADGRNANDANLSSYDSNHHPGGVCQVPLAMGFPRQEYWNGFPFPTPGDVPDLGIEPDTGIKPESPVLAGR